MRAVFQKLMRCPSCALAAFGIFFVTAIVVLFLADLRSRYIATISSAEQSTRSFAEVLAEHTARTFEAADHTLREAEAIRENLGNEAYPTGQSAHAALRHLKQTSPILVAIEWTSASGELVAHSYANDSPRHGLADSLPFTALRDNTNDNLYVGSLRSVSSGNPVIVVARRLNNPDGSFAGIVTALIDPSYFTSFYRSIQLGDGASASLMHLDGRLIAREPAIESAFAMNFAAGPLLGEHVPKADAGSYEDMGLLSGIARITGYKVVPGLPLVMRVSYSRATVLAPWNGYLRTFGSMVAALVIVILLGMILLVRQNRSLARKSNIFDITLQNMSQGLCMFDGMQTLVMCNQRYAAMYGLTLDQTKPGTPLREILDARVSNGNCPADARSYIDTRMEEVDRGEASVVVNQFRDGRYISITHQPLEGGGWIAVHQDITAQRKIEAEVVRMARYDALTDLANRTLFMENVGEALTRLRQRQEEFSILLLDLDQFKEVNDSLGHPVGDALLKSVAERLRMVARESDTVARLGGDEFAILQTVDSDQKDCAIVFANKILQALTEPYVLDGYKVMIGTSIGIALAPDNGTDPDQLLRNADLALYRTKAQGRNGYRFFEPWMEEAARSRRALEGDLRNAVARAEFELYYQTVIDIRTQEVCGTEALVRWHHPQRGLVSPDQFISLAEETGLIIPLGEWILRKACADAAPWPAHIKVAVNLSAVQFGKGDLLDIVTRALADANLAPERLELEVTESILLRNNGDNLAILNELKSLGVSVVLDDFGTGYSSLSYLQMFPFDKLKIDKSFVAELSNRAECAAIVCAVIGLGRSLGIGTTAEGVETREQFDLLRAAGCREAQGYLLSRPVPVSELFLDSPDGLKRTG
jgi:diguanylate cyclase (GGDEF)-like protein